jgi:hypothetical protein
MPAVLLPTAIFAATVTTITVTKRRIEYIVASGGMFFYIFPVLLSQKAKILSKLRFVTKRIISAEFPEYPSKISSREPNIFSRAPSRLFSRVSKPKTVGNDIHVYTNCHFSRSRSNGNQITTERNELRNLFKDVSTTLDMTGVN